MYYLEGMVVGIIKINKIANNVILLFLSLYLFYFCLLNTAMAVSLTSNQYNLFVLSFTCFSIYKVITVIKDKKYKLLIKFILIFVISLLTYIFGTYKFILVLSLITISLYGIEYKKVLKIYLIISSLVLIVALVSSAIGITANFVIIKSQTTLRSSWGICYPTELGAVFSYLSIFLFPTNDKYSSWLFLIPTIISFCIAKYIAVSRASMVSSTLLFILIILYSLYKYFKDKMHIPKQFIKNICMSLFLICAFIIFVLIFAYRTGNTLAIQLNTIFTGRLKLASQAIDNYGIYPFGSYFELYGAEDLVNYNFIDISYALILIRYGYVYFVMVTFLWIYTMRKVLKYHNYKLVIALIVIVINCMVEQHLNEINYNILFVMPFCEFENISEEYKGNIKFETIIFFILMIFTSICFIIFAPSILAYVRTYVEIYNFNCVSGVMRIKVVLFISILIIIFTLAFISFKKIIVNLITKQKIKIFHIISLAFLLLCFRKYESCKNIIYKNNYDEYMQTMEKESKIIQLVIKTKTGNLYASSTPEYYMEYFDGFSYSIYYGNDLARKNNATVITNKNDSFSYFISQGYSEVWAEDNFLIFSNDDAVIKALEENGDHFQK